MIAWNKFFRPEYEGCLGIRIEDANAAFLVKQGLKILTQPDNIWIRLVRAKYLKNDSYTFLRIKKSSSAFKA